jgi:integrase
MSQPDLFRVQSKPWNTGRIIGPKPPLKPKHIWAIRQLLKNGGQLRDLALFNCAIDAKLRGCDLVKLRVSDVAPGGAVRTRATIIQQKTGRPVPFEITEPTRLALLSWLAARGPRSDDWLFPSRSRPGEHLTTRQYARLVDRWVQLADLEPRAYGTHSLRRTKVALIYKRTGNLRACQLLLGHGKLESTVRYLGIVRWRRKFGQLAKVGSTSMKDGLYDWEAEAVHG